MRWTVLLALVSVSCGSAAAVAPSAPDGGGGGGGEAAPTVAPDAAQVGPDAGPAGADAAQGDAPAATPTACKMTAVGTFSLTLQAGHFMGIRDCLGVTGGGPLMLDFVRDLPALGIVAWNDARQELFLAAEGQATLHFFQLGATPPAMWELDVTVVSTDVTDVTVEADKATLQLYEQSRYHVVARYSDGSKADVTSWGGSILASGEDVVIVDSGPALAPLKIGSVQSTGVFLGQRGSGQIAVAAPAVNVTITAVPPAGGSRVGERIGPPDLQIEYGPGNSVFANPLMFSSQRWTSSDPSIVTVDTGGVTCQSAGKARVKLMLADREVTADWTCTP
jgi:hypothetical protein